MWSYALTRRSKNQLWARSHLSKIWISTTPRGHPAQTTEGSCLLNPTFSETFSKNCMLRTLLLVRSPHHSSLDIISFDNRRIGRDISVKTYAVRYKGYQALPNTYPWELGSRSSSSVSEVQYTCQNYLPRITRRHL